MKDELKTIEKCEIKIGDKYYAKSTVGRFLYGTVTYVHPNKTFVTLEFHVNGGSFQESYFPNQLQKKIPTE